MPLRTPPVTPPLKTGQYVYTSTPSGVSTSATLGVGVLRLQPWLLQRPLSFDRIGAEVTSAGEAGSKFRLGVYADDGTCFPGALLLDAGQIAGDSATVQELTVSLSLSPGLYWVGGAVQTVTTTQPTMRIVGSWATPVPLVLGTSAPSAGTFAVGFQQSSVTGALPSTFTTTITATTSLPRVHIRTA